ncbi:hypothetical protein MAFF211479_25850 [Ralstonia solanacearum]|uniref:hypothetical protein n=1 Tax=Ralstonia pseudosolanacearum TaxID=1310165 RepID=UPI0018A6863C|nr:hypothetical protein [Ralstonia pseudosolanacearum]BCL92884.1 hypothetical protein MAFF211479_25850 [Ralstonia solanacearum]BCL96735.1 hypothetical protein MAFF211491_11870 [Ralstonia solanacearum]BCM12048.1 hypothetical protein MAFF241648_12380 [Ralstonia solanacearum]BCN05450.1 hypothetical protein RPSB_25870 [Ralstonia solanacearum]
MDANVSIKQNPRQVVETLAAMLIQYTSMAIPESYLRAFKASVTSREARAKAKIFLSEGKHAAR